MLKFCNLLLSISLITGFLLIACFKPTQFEDRLELGEVMNRSNEQVSRPEDVKQITYILRDIFDSIQEKDLSRLPNYVNSNKGIWVDLKAEKTMSEFEQDIANPLGYVNVYYLNTNELQNRTNDTTQKSIYDLINSSKKINADFFFQQNECEVRLTIQDPKELTDESYRFNNAYFIENNGKWFLYRLF
ncbi:MAG: hypothetical protein H3C43_00335 [Leptonema sp. (in: Bacteria)]|nr:hypothetical protein [Leptonema sp. (in: bacteria)]